MRVDAVVGDDGLATVTQTIDLSLPVPTDWLTFGLITRQPYDDSTDQIITYDNLAVTSPTLGPMGVRASPQFDRDWLETDPPEGTTGRHTIVLTYTASGLVGPDPSGNGVRLNWNVIGTGWGLPMSDITVTIHGPSGLIISDCVYQDIATFPCTSTNTASDARYTQPSLHLNQDMTISATWPTSAFPGASLDLAPAAIISRDLSDITIDRDGLLVVTRSFSLRLATPTPTPCLTVPATISVGPNGDLDRIVTLRHPSLVVDFGPPVDLPVRRTNAGTSFCLGDPGASISGSHSYVVTYAISGGLNHRGPDTGTAVGFPPYLGDDPNLPLPVAVMVVSGPRPVDNESLRGVFCRPTNDRTKVCSWTTSGTTVTFVAAPSDAAQDDHPVANLVWAGNPFPGDSIRVVSSNPFRLSYGGQIAGGIAAGLIIAAVVVLVRLRRRNARNDRNLAAITFVGLTRIQQSGRPMPPDVPARTAAAVLRGEPDKTVDVAATVIDLAGKGAIRVRADGDGAFCLIGASADPGELDPGEFDPGEAATYQALFSGRTEINHQDLTSQEFQGPHFRLLRTLGAEFRQQDWYRPDPLRLRLRRAGVALSLLIAGGAGPASIALGVFLARRGVQGVGWFALPLILGGIIAVSLVSRVPLGGQTASATACQSAEFQTYLATADPVTMVRYLPYAIAYGQVKRWTDAWRRADQAAPAPPPWYESADGPPTWAAFAQTVDAIVAAFAHAGDGRWTTPVGAV